MFYVFFFQTKQQVIFNKFIFLRETFLKLNSKFDEITTWLCVLVERKLELAQMKENQNSISIP